MRIRAIRPLVLAAASLIVVAAPGFAEEKKAPAAAPAPAEKTPAKATDPVCGMEVDTKTAPSATYKGKTYYFCAPSEKTTFEKSPEKYVARKKSA